MGRTIAAPKGRAGKIKVATVIGTRPQFVKAAVVSHALQEVPNIAEVIIHTGQHYDENMSGVFFSELGIPEPTFNLGVGSGSHAFQIGHQLLALEKLLITEQPDWVLVYGDTNSTLAAALAATKLNIPLAHVEAGLRSFNRNMPEEINRVLTDHSSTILFAPTPVSCSNLEREGIPVSRVHQVGDVMFDSVLRFAEKAARNQLFLNKLGLSRGEYVLATVHRCGNTDDLNRFGIILRGLQALAGRMPVVFPVHPRTQSSIRRMGIPVTEISANLKLLPPVSYLEMLLLEKNAAVIVTDSGGVQKEAFFSGVPCVTLREETEWPELVDSGWSCLCPPTTSEAILDKVLANIGCKGRPVNFFGQGNAARRIAAILNKTPTFS